MTHRKARVAVVERNLPVVPTSPTPAPARTPTPTAKQTPKPTPKPTPAQRPRRGRGRPRGGDSAQTREQILTAAAELFAEGGYRATSMVAVAESSGLSQTGLLHHFPSKEALLAGVLERRDEQDLVAVGHPSSVRGWEALERLVRLVEHNMRREPFVRLFTTMAGEAVEPGHPGHAWLMAHHRAARSLVTTALEQAKADGSCDPEAPVARIADNVVALMDGLQVQWLMAPAGLDMAGDFSAYVADLRRLWGRGG